MPPVFELGREFRLADRTQGYSAGRTRTFRVSQAPGDRRELVVHTGLSYVQAFTGAPVGAASGIMSFTVAGPAGTGTTSSVDAAEWPAQLYGIVTTFTAACRVFHGEMRGWFFVQIWEG
jgi:hypothetical protein